MSSHERHRWLKRFKTLCASCQERKARFRYRGEVRADRDHTLCFECYRREINRARARRLSEPSTPPRMPSPWGHQEAAGGQALNERQLAHRHRMFHHLQGTRSVAS